MPNNVQNFAKLEKTLQLKMVTFQKNLICVVVARIYTIIYVRMMTLKTQLKFIASGLLKIKNGGVSNWLKEVLVPTQAVLYTLKKQNKFYVIVADVGIANVLQEQFIALIMTCFHQIKKVVLDIGVLNRLQRRSDCER
ncbi:MAG: hypothetical protein IKL42_00360 [Clostridia bacterium]|nr:hypothetical protein [Clostridia bacterium]MBR3575838.1 hypothetical protein [Clostridia bacterium]